MPAISSAHFTTLGDGRAILLGEQITPGGDRVDIQLKGAGRTPYSRRGDGRAALGPMLREYIISEAMHALGIPTSRSLAVVTTGEPVYRERPLPGAVLTRIAASHMRVGTFEWAAAHRDPAALARSPTTRAPSLSRGGEAHPRRYLELFEAIAERQAALIAQWQLVGFIHGVMNTDNMALSGETNRLRPVRVHGHLRSGHGVQLHRHARAATPTATSRRSRSGTWPGWPRPCCRSSTPTGTRAVELAQSALAHFAARFEHHRLAGMRAKLGLVTEEPEDATLAEALLTWMHGAGADFTNTFRALSAPGEADAALPGDAAFAVWHAQWRARLARQRQTAPERSALMQRANPAIVPRNHVVEAALTSASDDGDLAPLERLLAALATPYDHTRDDAAFRAPPAAAGAPYRTFCGT